MFSPASAPDAPTRLRSAVGIGSVAIGLLVAVGVAMVFLGPDGPKPHQLGAARRITKVRPAESGPPRRGTTNSHCHPVGASLAACVRAAHSSGVVRSSPD